MIDNMIKLVEFLTEVRKKYKLGSSIKVACECDVTEQTVRNFETMTCSPNSYVLMWHISKVLWELGHNTFYLANTASVTEEEVLSDRSNLITMMSTMF